MAIEYNPNKKTIFNNYIDVAVSNLKKAETEASCLLNFAFPSKTIIGRRFNKKSQIGTLKGNINSAYKSLSTIKSDVQEQVDKYLKANSNAIVMANSLNFHRLIRHKNGLYREDEIKEIRKIFKEYGDDEEKLKINLQKYGYSNKDLEDFCKYFYKYYRENRYKESEPENQKKAWHYYDLLNEILTYTTGVSHSNKIKETNPLDENYDELTDKTEDMLIYLCFMENTFTDSSQCQGAAWLGDNKIAICDIDGAQDKGVIRIFKINPDNPFDIEIITEIPVDGHSNDIEYLPDENIILHPNHQTKEIEAIYLNKELQKEKIETVQNIHANAIAYDKENDEIIIVEDINGEVYSKEDFLKGEGSKKEFIIPDQIKDKENDIYYNLRGGATAEDGKVYVSYTGYEKDQRQYHGDIPKGTMTAVYDDETGECLESYITNCNGEVETVTLDDEGHIIWVENCENNTYVLKSPNNKNEQ